MFATVLVYNCSPAVSGSANVSKGRANINAAMVRAAARGAPSHALSGESSARDRTDPDRVRDAFESIGA